VPRLAQGRALARIAAVTGCIDVSDGLGADLGHLLGRGAAARSTRARLPLPRGFAAGCRALGLDPIRARAGRGRRLRAAVRGAVRRDRPPPRSRARSACA
jgi:thiamine monophosphate kinase